MQHAIKWLFDRSAAVVLLLALAPFLLAIGLFLRVTTGPPVLYRQTRLGLHGKPFTLLKFRSMRPGEGVEVAPDDDPRITGPGLSLRRSRLDELPALFNVLIGDMSLVGPRPMTPSQSSRLHAGERAALLSVRPGVTGVSALAFLGDDAALSGLPDAEALYLEKILPAKIELELEYLDRWSLRKDVALMGHTMARLWSPTARARSRERVGRLLREPR